MLHGVINYLLLNEQKRVYAVFVDYTKAFDYLARDFIWYKLLKLDVRGKMPDIIKYIYTNVKSWIQLGNTISNEDFSCF